jgi:hypothetical protein
MIGGRIERSKMANGGCRDGAAPHCDGEVLQGPNHEVCDAEGLRRPRAFGLTDHRPIRFRHRFPPPVSVTGFRHRFPASVPGARFRDTNGAVFYRPQLIAEPIGEHLTLRMGGRSTPRFAGNARPQVKGQIP